MTAKKQLLVLTAIAFGTTTASTSATTPSSTPTLDPTLSNVLNGLNLTLDDKTLQNAADAFEDAMAELNSTLSNLDPNAIDSILKASNLTEDDVKGFLQSMDGSLGSLGDILGGLQLNGTGKGKDTKPKAGDNPSNNTAGSKGKTNNSAGSTLWKTLTVVTTLVTVGMSVWLA